MPPPTSFAAACLAALVVRARFAGGRRRDDVRVRGSRGADSSSHVLQHRSDRVSPSAAVSGPLLPGDISPFRLGTGNASAC